MSKEMGEEAQCLRAAPCDLLLGSCISGQRSSTSVCQMLSKCWEDSGKRKKDTPAKITAINIMLFEHCNVQALNIPVMSNSYRFLRIPIGNTLQKRPV